MGPMLRLAIWQGVDEWRAEAAQVDLGPRDLGATGTQIGADPRPYRLDYELEVGSGWITNRLSVQVTSAVGRRELLLEHDARGAWRRDGEPAPELAGAFDCDLGLSPLTNLMPVRRHGLHEREGVADIVAAWVSVPDLAVQPSRQRYEHVHTGVVRFIDLGAHEGFTAELDLDADGLVLMYPGLARRV
jgi:hypothetical protein